MRAIVAALLLVAMLSGCAQEAEAPASKEAAAKAVDALSEPVFDVLPVQEVFVEASDGTRLHHAVFRPDTNESVPVFINFSPYWGDTAEQRGDNFGRYLVDILVPRGYAVVLAAIRGTGHSEGCFEVASDREVQDLYEVVEHFANVEWSNGNVAAGGKSYDSTTQNGMIAKMPHPALKAVFHVSGITDMYRYNYVGGVPYANGLTFTPRYAVTYSQDGSHPDGQPYNLIDMVCPEMAEHVVSGTGSAAHGLKDAYWIERDWTRFIGDSSWNGSIFFVHGFQDWNVKPDHILPWIENLPDQIRVKGWLHQDTYNSGHVYPMRADWNETFVTWLDTELKGKGLAFWEGPAWDLEGTDGKWRHAEAWPPAPTVLEPDEIVPGDMPRLRFHFDDATRITGAPSLTVDATVANPAGILTATFEKDGQWVGEAVLRAVYRNGPEAPSAPGPGQVAYTVTAYPLDVVFEAGSVLEITLGADARYSITDGNTYGVVYDASSARLEAPLTGSAARADQPQATECFAC